MSSNIDKILDISSLTTSRGFIVSSSDEEDNISELKKSSNAIGTKLSNLFETVPVKPISTLQNAPKQLFAESFYLFATGNSGQMEGKGLAGVVVMMRNEQHILLIYNAAKQVIANFSLAPGNVSISVQYSVNSYLSISSNTHSVALLFDESKREQLIKLSAIFVIFCQIGSLDIYLGEGEKCSPGCHVLLEERRFNIENGTLKLEESTSQKHKLIEKSKSYLNSVLYLSKGGIRLIRINEGAVLFIIKKIKFPNHLNTKSILPSESESNLPPVENAQELSDIESEAASISEKTNDILTRIAKVGQPIVPVMSQEEQSRLGKEMEIEIHEDKPSTFDLTNLSTPIQAPSSYLNYPSFHKMIGTEMDRLEIRLEASVQRMIDRSLEPLQRDIKQLLSTQEKILDEISRLRSSSS